MVSVADRQSKNAAKVAQDAISGIQASSMAAGNEAQADLRKIMQANKESAQNSRIFQQATKKPSIFDRVGSVFNVAMTVLGISQFASHFTGNPAKPAGAVRSTIRKMALLNVPLDNLAAKSAELLGHDHVITKAAAKHAPNALEYAKNHKFIGGTKIGNALIEGVKSQSIANTAMSAVFGVQQAVGAFSDRKHTKLVADQMIADLQGIEGGDIVAKRIQKGSKSFAATGLQLGGAVGSLSLIFHKGGGGFIKNLAMGVLPGMAASFYKSGKPAFSAMNAYEGMTLSFAQTGRVDDVKLYKDLIGGLNPGLGDKQVGKYAEEAMKAQLSQKEVLAMIAGLADPGKRSFVSGVDKSRAAANTGRFAPA